MLYNVCEKENFFQKWCKNDDFFFTYFTIICAKSKGRRLYPFCHAKRRSDVFGGWAGKNIFIMTFCERTWFQIRSQFKRKNIIINKNKKLQCTRISFPFHHGSYLGGICS